VTTSLGDAPRTASLVLNPLDHPIIFATPRRLPTVSAWREHIPFAMMLIDLSRPGVLVELGTHFGASYCAFCQAVDELRLDTRCYAVDTWEGDPHSGSYGPEVLADLRSHHDPLYARFSRLIQSTFDDALAHFSEGSVDLLHLDGFHTYEASRHDFDAWLPKLSSRGVVLLHDINSRERDFGVWRLWEEVKQAHPHLELRHAHGLGVLAVGAGAAEALRPLFELEGERLNAFRELLFQLGYRLRLQLQLERTRQDGHEERRRFKGARREVEALAGRLAALEEQLTATTEELESFTRSPLARAGRLVQDALRRGKPRRS
jgi:hypothetical protein